LSLDVRVVETRLPPATAHPGAARRAAMELVEAGGRDGVILYLFDEESGSSNAAIRVEHHQLPDQTPAGISENLMRFSTGLNRLSKNSTHNGLVTSGPDLAIS
jgi:hypothetical protein